MLRFKQENDKLFPLIYQVGEVEVLESIVNRMGMSSSIFVKCDCGMTEFLGTGDHSSNETTPRTIQGKDLNRRIVYGAFEMRVGKECISTLCEMLNMLFSMSFSTWYDHEEVLG